MSTLTSHLFQEHGRLSDMCFRALASKVACFTGPNVQNHGLQQTYRENEAVHRYIRSLMALPFLPTVQIPEVFESLKPRAQLPQLASLVDYIDRQWFRNPVFRVDDWSVFRQTIRTNNDVEGV